MRQSQIFGKTLKEDPKDEVSLNAKLLERGGFVAKASAGVYAFWPLGWRVVEKIVGIVRAEMNKIGGEEIFMPALVDKKYWQATGRWEVEIGLEVIGKKDKEANFVLGWTHEDILTALAEKNINSYKDLPKAVYQFQTKFRNEPRAKSGLLRGREFLMKDLYSFHESEKDLFRYYERVKEAYFKIFKRCGLEKVYYTLAGGGDFTISNTHEFQVPANVGEDEVFICEKCGYAENSEISKMQNGKKCPKCSGRVLVKNSIEVGNIFPLGTKYAEAFGLSYTDKSGNKKPVVMGSYGIGIGRLMGAIVEIHNDERGIIWPETVAPFKIHLLELVSKSKSSKVKREAQKLYNDLLAKDFEVLYDDRGDKTAGEKFADADLIGIPLRVVVSEKTLEKNGVEIKKRSEKNVSIEPIKDLFKKTLSR